MAILQMAGWMSHGGAAFVALAEDLEQEFGTNLAEGHVAQLVDDQQLDVLQLGLELHQPLLVTCLHQPGAEGMGGDEQGHFVLSIAKPSVAGVERVFGQGSLRRAQ